MADMGRMENTALPRIQSVAVAIASVVGQWFVDMIPGPDIGFRIVLGFVLAASIIFAVRPEWATLRIGRKKHPPPSLKQHQPQQPVTVKPTLEVAVERHKADDGLECILCVRSNNLSWYSVSAKATFLYGSETELTQLTEREHTTLEEQKTYWLPVSGTNDVSAPLESGASVRFAFARQHQRMFQLCTVDRSGYFSPTGGCSGYGDFA